jgi:hypothetical protein
MITVSLSRDTHRYCMIVCRKRIHYVFRMVISSSPDSIRVIRERALCILQSEWHIIKVYILMTDKVPYCMQFSLGIRNNSPLLWLSTDILNNTFDYSATIVTPVQLTLLQLAPEAGTGQSQHICKNTTHKKLQEVQQIYRNVLTFLVSIGIVRVRGVVKSFYQGNTT